MAPTTPLIIFEGSQDWVPYDVLVWTEPTSTSTTSPFVATSTSTNEAQGLSGHHADAQIHTKCHLHQLQAF